MTTIEMARSWCDKILDFSRDLLSWPFNTFELPRERYGATNNSDGISYLAIAK